MSVCARTWLPSVLLVAVVLALVGATSSSSARDLQSIEEELAEAERRQADVQERIDAASAAYDELQSRTGRLEDEAADLERRLETLRADLDEIAELVRGRVREVFKHGVTLDPIAVFLGSEEPSAALSRAQTVERVVSADRARSEELLAAQARVVATEELLAERTAELAAAQAEERELTARLQDEYEELDAIAASLSDEAQQERERLERERREQERREREERERQEAEAERQQRAEAAAAREAEEAAAAREADDAAAARQAEEDAEREAEAERVAEAAEASDASTDDDAGEPDDDAGEPDDDAGEPDDDAGEPDGDAGEPDDAGSASDGSGSGGSSSGGSDSGPSSDSGGSSSGGSSSDGSEGGSSSGGSSGASACPLDQPRSFIDSWGHARSGGRAHRGTDLMGPKGIPVRAIVSGVYDIRPAGPSAGLWAVLVGDDGNHYWYMHLDRHTVSDGARVSAGQQVGTNGSTGNAVAGAEHVHFEMHPGGGAAVNPYPTLRRVCG